MQVREEVRVTVRVTGAATENDRADSDRTRADSSQLAMRCAKPPPLVGSNTHASSVKHEDEPKARRYCGEGTGTEKPSRVRVGKSGMSSRSRSELQRL